MFHTIFQGVEFAQFPPYRTDVNGLTHAHPCHTNLLRGGSKLSKLCFLQAILFRPKSRRGKCLLQVLRLLELNINHLSCNDTFDLLYQAIGLYHNPMQHSQHKVVALQDSLPPWHYPKRN